MSPLKNPHLLIDNFKPKIHHIFDGNKWHVGTNIVNHFRHVRDLNQAKAQLGGPKNPTFYHATFDFIVNQEL